MRHPAQVAWTAALAVAGAFGPGPSRDVARADPIATAADRLPLIAQFNRCYGTIVRERVKPTQRYYEAVKSGAMTAAAACSKIIAESSFGGANPDQEEKAKVIQTFSDLHRSWFTSDNYSSSVPIGEVYGEPARYLHDPGEPAHYVTRSMFGNLPYASVVEENSGMLAIRNPNQPAPVYPGAGGMGPLAYNNGVTDRAPINAPLQRTGDIVEIQRMADHAEYAATVMNPVPGWKAIPVFQHFGGGLLGSQSFLQLNFGRVLEDNDGGLKVPRRWSKAIISDVLCRDVPAIRLEDAQPLVQETSDLPFRKQASCMQCHATMDQMGDTARNLRYMGFRVPPGFSDNIHMVSYDVSGADYKTQAPTGKLFFRSFSGDLIDVPVNGIAALGAAIAATDDFYVCAASRYFEFFTGLRASLQDLGDKAVPPLDAGDLAYRDAVIALGKKFRKSGNIQALIKDILNTDFYQTAGMRKAVKVE